MEIFEAQWDPIKEGRILPDWKLPRLVEIVPDLFTATVPPWMVDEVIQVVAANPIHTFKMCTRLPAAMRSYFQNAANKARGLDLEYEPLPNLWIGVSAPFSMVDQYLAVLLETPARVRYFLQPSLPEYFFEGRATMTVVVDGRIDWIDGHPMWPDDWDPPQWTKAQAIEAGEDWGLDELDD